MEKYEGVGLIYLNGRLLAQATKVSVTVKSNDNVVNTMVLGFNGFSDGPGNAEATIESAIPKKGYEVDFVECVRKKKTVDVVVLSGGQRHKTQGRITEAKWDNATDSTTLMSASYMGKMLASRGG